MGKFEDLCGQKFNRLTVLERAENAKDENARWLCRCECGNLTTVLAYNLKNASVKSCGCLRRESSANIGKGNQTHGMSSTPIYDIWVDIKKRCYNPACPAYPNYGGRNIKMFEGWINDFQSFL